MERIFWVSLTDGHSKYSKLFVSPGVDPHAFSAESQVSASCSVYGQHLLQKGVNQRKI